MNFWMATQWPPGTDYPHPYHHGVYLQHDKVRVVNNGPSDGDLVLSYQFKTGPKFQVASPDSVVIRRRPGQEGIVAVLRISGEMIDNAGDVGFSQIYDDGRQMQWRYRWETETVDDNGFVPRSEAAIILGYSPRYAFRGFGDDNSGLKRINKTTYEALYEAFKSYRTWAVGNGSANQEAFK